MQDFRGVGAVPLAGVGQPIEMPRLQVGDRLRLVSPSSTPDRAAVERGVELFRSWGLDVEVGEHAFDQHGHYLAGRDEDRAADLNAALRDPGVRAVITTTGGKGAYRIAQRIDFQACSRDPKPLAGFSETCFLHLLRWDRCRLPGLHSPNAAWHQAHAGPDAGDELRRALMDPAPVTVMADSNEVTAPVVVAGKATGPLIGGNVDVLRSCVGWGCPSFAGAILLLEAVDMFIGAIDRSLTQLRSCGVLGGVAGVAVGQFIRAGAPEPGKWSAVEVLLDHLEPLGVPVLGGLPIGHGPRPHTIPLGTTATIDTASRTLEIAPAVV